MLARSAVIIVYLSNTHRCSRRRPHNTAGTEREEVTRHLPVSIFPRSLRSDVCFPEKSPALCLSHSPTVSQCERRVRSFMDPRSVFDVAAGRSLLSIYIPTHPPTPQNPTNVWSHVQTEHDGPCRRWDPCSDKQLIITKQGYCQSIIALIF